MHDSDPARKLTKSQSTVGGTTPRAALYAAQFGIAGRSGFVIRVLQPFCAIELYGELRPLEFESAVALSNSNGRPRIWRAGRYREKSLQNLHGSTDSIELYVCNLRDLCTSFRFGCPIMPVGRRRRENVGFYRERARCCVALPFFVLD